VHVAVADHRPAVPRRPPFGERVEIQLAREHRVVFDGVEQIRMPVEIPPEAYRRREERMRCDDEAGAAPLQPREVVERPDFVGPPFEIQQQDVLPGNGALDTGNEDDATLRGVRSEPIEVQLPLVQRDRQGVKTEVRGAIDEVGRGIRNPVYRVIGCMGMEFDFEHRPLPLSVSVPTRQRRPLNGTLAKTTTLVFGLKLFSV